MSIKDKTKKPKITPHQIELLQKYNIDYNVETLGELLINIDWVMTDYLDANDNPTDDFRTIERLYDEIYSAN